MESFGISCEDAQVGKMEIENQAGLANRSLPENGC